MDEYYNWDVDSVGHKHWPEFMYVGQWPIFHGPVILLYILKTIWWTIVLNGILVPCDAKVYLIKSMLVSDIHFMVQWFCRISWRLFDGLKLYRRYWFSVTQTLNWKYICRSFHCPVILSYILKTIWWIIVILEILIQCDTNIDLKLYM